MQFRSYHYYHDFTDKSLNRRLLLAGVAFLTVVYFVALSYADLSSNHGSIRTKHISFIRVIFDGLSNMDFIGYFLIIFVGGLISVLVLALSSISNEYKFIIVGFDFNEDEEELTLFLRNLTGSLLSERTIPYRRIKTELVTKMDGMSRDMFETIVIYDRSEEVGIYYKKHEMWEGVNQTKLEKKIYLISN